MKAAFLRVHGPSELQVVLKVPFYGGDRGVMALPSLAKQSIRESTDAS